MDGTVWFRWLGVAGIELRLDEQILAIDPFLTRPPFRRMWSGRIQSDSTLVEKTIPRCDVVLLTHAHHDHLMDAPEVVRQTGAMAYGSPNACRLLAILGVPGERLREIKVGDHLFLGHFQVEVLPAKHLKVPGFSSGPLAPDLRPPLRMREYRMDACFGFLIEAGGRRWLHWGSVSSESARPADVLCVSPITGARYYEALLAAVQPRMIIPIHWDDLFRPLSRSIRPYWEPPRLAFPPLKRVDLAAFSELTGRIAPGAKVFIPEIFRLYDLGEVL